MPVSCVSVYLKVCILPVKAFNDVCLLHFLWGEHELGCCVHLQEHKYNIISYNLCLLAINY